VQLMFACVIDAMLETHRTGCCRRQTPILYIIEDLSVRLCVPNRLLNHATQRDQALHEGVNKFGEGHRQQSKIFRT